MQILTSDPERAYSFDRSSLCSTVGEGRLIHQGPTGNHDLRPNSKGPQNSRAQEALANLFFDPGIPQLVPSSGVSFVDAPRPSA